MNPPDYQCPFAIGNLVAWKENVPKTWLFTKTPGPLKVVSMFWHDGKPTQYALRFGDNGFNIKPGWIIGVEYDADTNTHYDPPLKLLLGKWIRTDIHEMWLKPSQST